MPFRYWLFISLTLSLTGLIGYGTYTTARLLRTWRPDRNLLLLPGENALRLLLVAFCVGLGWISGLSLAQLGWVFPNGWSQALWGVAWGALLALFFYISTRWLIARTGQRFYSSVVLETVAPDNWSELLWVAAAMIPVVALEELLFRSLLLGGLLPLAPAPLLLVGLGALFGFMHAPQGIWGMIGAGLAGVFFGVIFLHQGSILMPLMAHYVANMLQIVQAMQRPKFFTWPSIHQRPRVSPERHKGRRGHSGGF
jgi:hypothetical protein